MTRTCAAVAMLGLLLGGCPTQPGANSAVHALITISSTKGPAPLTVVVSADQSTSQNGGDLQYAWDFADGTTSSKVTVTHTFTSPGRYLVTLRVTDQAGEEGIDSAEVRVAGSGAVAVIAADPTSGEVPLLVQFDGTQSLVPDDTILDYFWDFGDGGDSREAKPTHSFQFEGEYTVRLRIVTAGGVEAQTTTTITVGVRNASLQFDGTSLATLPLGSARTLAACTVEAWVRAENEGGTAISVGNAELTVELRPGDNTIVLTAHGFSTSASATSLTGGWRHVAAVYNGAGVAGSCVLYLDGGAIGQVNAAGALTPDRITIGTGFRGRIADVRFWGVARSAAEVAANRGQRLTGAEPDLIGYWPINEGSGQTLNNAVSGGADGTLGLTASQESADPAWSSDGPPI